MVYIATGEILVTDLQRYIIIKAMKLRDLRILEIGGPVGSTDIYFETGNNV